MEDIGLIPKMESTSADGTGNNTQEIIPKDNVTVAEDKRKLGNEQYKAQNYEAALKFYSDAVLLCPDSATNYANRSACFIMLSDYTNALNDARTAVRIDPTFERAYARIAKCCLVMGDLVGADFAIKQVDILNLESSCIKNEQQTLIQLRQLEETIKNNFETKSYRNVVYYLDNAMKIAPFAIRYRLLKAECLAMLNRCDEALDIAIGIMKVDNTSADAIYVRGFCLYLTDNLDKSVKHFERVLQLDPDHNKAKEMRNKSKVLRDLKEKGNTLFKAGRYREAHTVYSEALKIDEINKDVNSKLYYNRALVNSKIGSLRESISDCSQVLEINSQYLKALLLRARCYYDLENFDECVNDYEAALLIQKTADIKKLLRDAKFSLKKSKRKDYYKILGIPRNATDDEIKKAYRKKALVHHPDRHADSSLEKKKGEELKFKEVGEAYAILSDQRKKLRYDNGQDMDEQEMDFDPNQMFRHFFQFTGGSAQGTYGFDF